jgi:Cys-tRNA(Pro)/Cys-tRNA(Cys) deacylase
MSTRAIQTVKNAKLPFEVITYIHKEKGAAFASRATGFPLEKTVKTLIADLGRRWYAAALLPGNLQLDLKKLARVFHTKNARMADITTAERLSGYFVGGISPFGLKQPFEFVMDRSIMNYQEIFINGGQRGVMLKMAPGDILHVLKCRTAEIGKRMNIEHRTSNIEF